MLKLTQNTRAAFDWATTNIDGFVSNPQQLEYALLVAESLKQGCASRIQNGHSSQLLIEGETGTGKTLGYLVPSMLHAANNNKRVVISTFTLHLQRQIMKANGDFERACAMVSAITGKTLTVARRIGRGNFVDIDRVYAFADYFETEKNVDALEVMSNLITWHASTESGEFADWVEESGLALPADISQDDICLTEASSSEASCFYFNNVVNGKSADVVLVTHMMICLAGKCGWRLLHESDDARDIGALIVDEADRLPSVAQNLTGGFVSLYSLSDLSLKTAGILSYSKEGLFEAGKSLWDEVAAAYIPGSEKGIVFWSDLTVSRRKSISDAVDVFVSALSSLYDLSRNKIDGIRETADRDTVRQLISSVTEIREIQAQIKDTKEYSGIALRWSPKKEYPSFKSFCLRPAHILRRLWSAYTDSDGELKRGSRVDSLILTSATISTPGKEHSSFDQSLIDFGIYEPNNPCRGMHQSFSPSWFGSAQFVFPDPSVNAPFVKSDEDTDETQSEVDPEWLHYASKMAEQAHDTGITLMLVGSYRVTAMLAETLVDRNLNIVQHRRGERMSVLLERLRQFKNAVFITPVAWEGIDEPHLFDNVIISQLPYRSPDDVNSMAMLRYLAGKGKIGAEAKNILHVNTLAHALRRFKQGFGRGIRAFDDSFTLWVADPRFVAPTAFKNDIMGIVPQRGTAKATTAFASSIPKRFRFGIGNPYHEGSRMMLADGKMISTDDLA